jgi:hypothetical protein
LYRRKFFFSCDSLALSPLIWLAGDQSTHALAHPLPSSYPAIFHESDFLDSSYKGDHAPLAVSAFSSISTNNGIAKMFSTYAKSIQSVQRQGSAVYSSVGLEADEVRELINDLWTLHDGYEGAGA